MDKFDTGDTIFSEVTNKLLDRCFKCKSYQEDECGIYFMMALWQKECPFFINNY